MTTKTYELVVKINQNVRDIYHLIGGYITGHVEKKEFCDGECSFDVEDVMAQYSAETKDSNPYYFWWNKNTCFKGENNTRPYMSCASMKPFYDSNFPSIIFSGNKTDTQVREKIKAQFFKKFDTIIDKVDNSRLIDEIKVRIDSDAFTEQYSRKYCYELLKEYEMLEKMFSGYVINKIESTNDDQVHSAITFFLKEEPTKNIVDDLIARIYYLINNYEELMKLTNMENKCFYSEKLSEMLDDPFNFQVIGVDLVEHVTTSKIKNII